MSHIQGQPHPTGTIEHLDYIRVDVDGQGVLTHIAVVTHHTLNGIDLPQQVITYHTNPAPGQRPLQHAIPPARRTTLEGFVARLALAATFADSTDDPAPPIPIPPFAEADPPQAG